MKKIFKALAYAAVVTAAFTSCNKELEVVVPDDPKEFVYTFNLGDDIAFTKALLDNDGTADYIKWTAGDQLGSITNNTQGYSDITPATNETPAQFKIKSKDGLEAGNTINVWFPYLSTQTNPEAVSFEISKEQTLRVSDNKFNFRNMPMVAKQVTVTAGMASETDETAIATINMANLGSVVLFKVFSTDPGRATEKVKSISFNARNATNTEDANIAGIFSKNLTTIDPDDEETMGISFTTGFSSIKSSLITPASIGSNKAGALDIYMVVAPGSYTGTINVKTDKALYTYTLSSPKDLVRSGIKAFGLDLASATLTSREDAAPEFASWVKTDITALKEGDVVTIVDTGSERAMSNDKGTSKAPVATSVTITDGTTISNVESNLQWLFENPSYGVYRFKVAGTNNYLYATNTNDGVRVGSTDSSKDFKIKQDASSNDYLFNAGTSRYLGVYSSQDWRCYTSSGGNIADTRIAFFKKVVTEGSKYSITINNTTPTFGTITTTPSGAAYETATVGINITPQSGYVLDALSVVDGSSKAVTVTSNQFTMPSSNVTITASFRAASADPELSFSNSAYEFSLGDDDYNAFAGQALSNPNSVSPIVWTSSNEDLATVSNGTVTFKAGVWGETTIRASFAGNATYEATYVEYTITVLHGPYTTTFRKNNFSTSINDYTSTWDHTDGGLTWSLVNWNNNQKGWDFVKAGRKNNASVGTITTKSAVPEAICKVTLTIDAVTASKINSLKLKVSGKSDMSNATEYSFTVATGDKSVTIGSPASNKYYQIVADCASGSSNGLISVSQIYMTNIPD
ncbi:MAG: hypothetical protein IKZ51_05475 [Bacteroidales bacterium]|nr:hypothetical protein [Bacteroidales bacterium]